MMTFETQNGKRKSWSNDETKLLIESWDSVGSITLLSLILKRSPSSIQTQASRIGLPRRNEQLQRHRRRWQEEEEVLLNRVLEEETDSNGKIRIDKIASKLDRTVDAVIAKLADDFYDAETLLKKIYIPDSKIEKLLRKDNAPVEDIKIDPLTGKKQIEDTRRSSKMRKCLTCTKPFWSEGAHNRVCDKCKKIHEGDDWLGGY